MKNLQKKIEQLIKLYKSNNLLKAETVNAELIRSYPKVVVLYNIMGLILTDQNKINEAIKTYEKGIEINPGYAMIHNNLGSIYKSKEDYIKAESFYKRSITLDNKIPEPHNNLGSLYLTLNKFKKAISCFKESLNINPKFYVSHYNLGVLYKTIGNFKKAKKYLTKSIKLNHKFYSAHRTLSQITNYTIKDDHYLSLKKIYQNSKENSEPNADIIFALGKASEDIKDYDNSFKYYNEANDLRRKEIDFSIDKEKNIVIL